MLDLWDIADENEESPIAGLSSKLSIAVDYITLVLTKEFPASYFIRHASQPIIDKSTGEIKRIAIESNQFKINNPYGVETVSLFAGSEFEGMKLAKEHNLKVTRLDLCLTIATETSQQAGKWLNFYSADIKKLFAMTGNKPSFHTFEGSASRQYGSEGFNVWARSSDHQLRCYRRKADNHRKDDAQLDNNFVRVEWQLRREYAQKAFDAIKGSYPRNTKIQFNVFQSIVTEKLKKDFFNLGGYDEIEIKPAPRDTDSDYEAWLFNIIAPSLARQFRSNKRDYCAELQAEVNRLILKDETALEAVTKTYQQQQVARATHKVRTQQERKAVLAAKRKAAKARKVNEL